MINLGTLKEIDDLRSVWQHEALNFTPWVAENVDLLADAVGLDITVDETESSVGDFNVDIYASETGTDRKIIIENQLEDTDHDHLGKLITYAFGKGADVVIWQETLRMAIACETDDAMVQELIAIEQRNELPEGTVFLAAEGIGERKDKRVPQELYDQLWKYAFGNNTYLCEKAARAINHLRGGKIDWHVQQLEEYV